MICPKCGYTRKRDETAPDTQCPSCGVYYAKVPNQTLPSASKTLNIAEDKPSKKKSLSVGMGLLALVVGVAIAIAFPGAGRRAGITDRFQSDANLLAPDGRTPLRELDLSRATIVMYSLTTCGYCAALRKTFQANGIPFREYFVDTDPARQAELFSKLRDSGYQGGGIGTPTLEVNGTMMPNNPPLADIIREATGGEYKRRAG